MTLKLMDATGVLRTITRLGLKAGGIRQHRTLKLMDENGDLQLVAVFAPPLLLTVTPDFVFGLASNLTNTAVSQPATGTPTGGLAPYTYAWTQISGAPMTIGTPTSATTVFVATLTPGQTLNGSFRCTVTDAVGTTASDTVSVEMEHSGF